MSKERRRIKGILDLARKFPALPLSGLEASCGIFELDDCAVVPLHGEYDLVIGSDFVRGEDFHLYRAGRLSRKDLGYYLVGANLSDLAAMGASPIGIVVAFRYSPDMTDEQFRDVMEGVCEACADYSAPLLGGDTGGYPLSVLSASAIGLCPRGRALLRSGGKAGDVLFISGEVGQAGAALAYFTKVDKEKHSLSREQEDLLLGSWRKIRPAILQGRLLTQAGISRCGIDTSDGLKIACQQIAEASHVDVILHKEAIPVAASAREVALMLGLDPIEFALGDSVDFRLLFSAPEQDAEKVKLLFKEDSWPLFEIGKLAQPHSQPGAYFETDTGLIPLPGMGWVQ